MSLDGAEGRGLGTRLGEIAIWTIAALSVAGAHAGAVALLLKDPAQAAADNAPPAAIMIELSPEPEAAATEEDVVAPDAVDAEEVKTAAIDPQPVPPPPEPVTQPVAEAPPEPAPPEPAPAEPAPPEPQPTEAVETPLDPPPAAPEQTEPMPAETAQMPEAPPPVETPPPQELAAQMPPEPLPAEPLPPEPLPPEPLPPEPVVEPSPIEQQQTAALDNVEVPLPMFRPLPPLELKPEPSKPEPRKPEARTEPKKKPPARKAEAAPAASQAAQKAQAKATQSDRTAATQTSSGGGSSISPDRWQSRLMSHLERRKRYPAESRSNREQGTVMVRFSIDNSGNVLSVSLSRSSGYPALDRAVVEMVRAASPVPAPPPGVSKTIVAPVQFSLR